MYHTLHMGHLIDSSDIIQALVKEIMARSGLNDNKNKVTVC